MIPHKDITDLLAEHVVKLEKEKETSAKSKNQVRNFKLFYQLIVDSIFFFIVLRNYYRTKISRTPRRTLVKYIFQRRVRLKPHPQRIPLGGREQRRRLLHLAQPQRNRAPRRNLRDRRRRNNNIPNRNLQNRFQNYLQRHQPNIQETKFH